MATTDKEKHRSEVAALVAAIATEYEAGQRGLQGLASGTARHDFITARMEGMERAREELTRAVGLEQATALMNAAIEQAGKPQ